MTSGQIAVLTAIAIIAAAWGVRLLYRHFTRSKRRIQLLIDSLDADDTTLRFPVNGHDRQLNRQLNAIAARLSEIRANAVETDTFYRNIISTITTGIIVTDSRGYVVKCSDRALNLLGMAALPRVSSLHDKWPQLEEYITNATAGSATSIGNMAVRTSSFVKRNGERLLITTIDDISAELDSQSVEAWSDMSRVLSHEILNGIAPISSITETLLMRADGDSAVREGLEAIKESSDGLRSFVTRYNHLTRVAPACRAEFDLTGLISRCCSMAAGNVKVKLNSPLQPATVMADEGQIQQVIINLLKNAIEAGAGNITIKISLSDASATATVINDGEAIPTDVASRIFTPFYTTKRNGSGVGLSLSRRIMKENGGTLTLMSTDPVTFAITLPRP